ncbi:uncharacterized protein LOC129588957 [Paramacrobiotus metropolitanus]|uniref:uncharacterized protein LOC129588957 n=1 Tax=Paramacrobiotus metropolitanus TaxID=2943436 RepID=UPI0024463073|nr:uncharacterized protein LOC129588957 [Paramacrobiotus metropolitanus]
MPIFGWNAMLLRVQALLYLCGLICPAVLAVAVDPQPDDDQNRDITFQQDLQCLRDQSYNSLSTEEKIIAMQKCFPFLRDVPEGEAKRSKKLEKRFIDIEQSIIQGYPRFTLNAADCEVNKFLNGKLDFWDNLWMRLRKLCDSGPILGMPNAFAAVMFVVGAGGVVYGLLVVYCNPQPKHIVFMMIVMAVIVPGSVYLLVAPILHVKRIIKEEL